MIGIGTCVAVGAAPATSGAPAPAENLLRWTEALDNAVWTASGVTVTANAAAAPTGPTTAERLTFDPGGQHAQASLTAATTGGSVSGSAAITGTWQRFEVTGVFDGLSYTYSIYLRAVSGGTDLNFRIFRAGGFLNVALVDISEVAPDVYAWGEQLEQAGAATAYVSRTT